jgi:hypothetical protein
VRKVDGQAEEDNNARIVTTELGTVATAAISTFSWKSFFYKTHPPMTKENKIVSHFICTTCFNPDLGPLQLVFYNLNFLKLSSFV